MFEEISILFEDKDVLVVNKPPGIVVNIADTLKEETVQSWFGRYLGDAKNRVSRADQDWKKLIPDDFSAVYGTPEEIYAQRGGVVHRLDRDTSGVLLLAKNPGSLVALLAQFKKRQVKKEYVCLVHGKLQVETDVVLLPLARATRDRKLFEVSAGGRTAETTYKVLRFFPEFNREELAAQWEALKTKAPQGFRKRLSSYQSFSLLRCFPKTGRTHQIRVHLAHIKHPIVGDQVYGGKKRQKLDAVWCQRQFLHAEKLEFAHPRSAEKVPMVAPLTADLTAALRFLKSF